MAVEAMDADDIPISSAEVEHIDSADVAMDIISRFDSSPQVHHRRLCSAAAAIAQTIRDLHLTPSPAAYFAAAASALSADDSTPSLAPIFEFLSLVLPRVNPAVVRLKWSTVADAIYRVLKSYGGGGDVDLAKNGVRFAGQMLVVADKGDKEGCRKLFMVVLGFVTDSRIKVRKQAHIAVQNVLRSSWKTEFCSAASKEITSLLERSLLLAGGSKSSESVSEEGPRGAVQVLYILNALKDCLPLMTAECTNNVLRICKPLLGLRQTIVTRNIMEILNALCHSETSCINSNDLLDLLCSMALSVNDYEKSGDWMASVARLLHSGTKKVYGLDRQKCLERLPSIFSSLGDILGTEHEEAAFAATVALKDLIYACVDDALVSEAIERIKAHPNGGIRSSPTAIEKICATLEGFLSYRYSAVWDMSFQVLSAAFDRLGRSSSALMAGTVRTLADIENVSDEDLPFRKQLHECLGMAVGAMGPQALLSIIPLNLEVGEIAGVNFWLLPILKHHIVGANLRYFINNIMGMVKFLQQKSRQFEMEGKTYSARSTEGVIYALWALLPSFCNYPIDTASSFRGLQKIMCDTLRQEPELRGLICTSLQVLIRQNLTEDAPHSDISNETTNAAREAKDRYTSEFRNANLEVIKFAASDFLEALRDSYLTSSRDDGGCLLATIYALASVADEKVITKFVEAALTKIFKVTKETLKLSKSSSSMQVDNVSFEASLTNTRASLLDYAVAFLPGLDTSGIGALYPAIKGILKREDEESLIQKKAYKALSSILKEKKEFLMKNLEELHELMTEALPLCHISAKRHRLDCLYFIIVKILEDPAKHQKTDIMGSFLTEIIIALKESNKKTRNRAYDILVEIGHAYGDEERGGRRENLFQFFNMVAGNLTSETPHMISAAVKGLARLAYEFSDLITAAYSLLPSAFLLLRRNNREIVKANLGLIKVLVAKSKTEGLQDHLKAMLEGLLKWQDGTKSHFKAKIKMLVEMLVSKCGLEAVKAVMPPEHMKLLANIRKTKERKERKAKSEDSESLHSKTSGISRRSRWNHTHIFSDCGDDGSDDELDEATTFGRGSKASYRSSFRALTLRSNRMQHQSAKIFRQDLLGQLEGNAIENDPLDLLDSQKMRTALQSSAHLRRKSKQDNEAELDDDGRLIVRANCGSPKKEKSRSFDSISDIMSRADRETLASSSGRTQKKRKKTAEVGWAYTGTDYTNKKGGGDMLKKNMLEPYAYWPLDRKLLNRRAERKAIARKGMARVIKSTKKLEGRSASAVLSDRKVNLKGKTKHKGAKNFR